jgi:hypothetical protein
MKRFTFQILMIQRLYGKSYKSELWIVAIIFPANLATFVLGKNYVGVCYEAGCNIDIKRRKEGSEKVS